MVANMEVGLKLADGIFARCDTCLRNFRKSVCELNCSPKHSQYVSPAEIGEAEVDGKTVKYIKSVDFYMSEKHIEGVYESCKGVTVPSSGGFAMDLACPIYGSRLCTAKKWVSFYGAYFRIVFHIFVCDFSINYHKIWMKFKVYQFCRYNRIYKNEMYLSC